MPPVRLAVFKVVISRDGGAGGGSGGEERGVGSPPPPCNFLNHTSHHSYIYMLEIQRSPPIIDFKGIKNEEKSTATGMEL